MNAQARQVIMWCLLGLVGIAMLAGIGAMVTPSRSLPDEVMITALVVGLHAAAGLLIVPIGRRSRLPLLVALSSLGVGMAFSVIFIWFESSMKWQQERVFFRFLWFFEILAGMLAHWMLVRPMAIDHVGFGRVLRRVTLWSGIVAGVLMMLGACFEVFDDGGVFVRLFGVSIIMTVGCTMCCGAMLVFTRRDDHEDPGLLTGSITVDMTCPRCEHPIEARSNRETRCEHCRLRVRVEVEEPRCACGYLLYQLESDTCPECGKPIAAEDRWEPQPS
ncbi:MAG: hypothetical protein ACX94C_00220 [Phycisphaerales bacterium]